MKKEMLRIVLLGAALSTVSFTGLSRAADEPAKPADTTPAKPADSTPGQPPADNRSQRPRFNPADMLKNYRDQFEGLNLTDDQMKKIDGFLATAEAEVAKAANSQDPETRRSSFQAIRKLSEDVQSVLTDEQKTALRTKRTSMMFDRMKTGLADNEKLKLTDDQKSKINAILDDAKKQAASLTAGADQQQDRQKFFDLMRSTRDKIKEVLTPEQQKEIPQFGPGGRGGPGGRNRGPGGQGGGNGNPPAAPGNNQ